MPLSAEPSPVARDFASFYRATLAPLRRYLGRLLGNSSDAQDVAHDAYSRVFTTMAVQEVEQPQGLLYTTARNLAINQLRRRGRSPILAAEAEVIAMLPSAQPGVEQVVMARAELAALKAAVAELPLGCRTVFLLCQFEGLTHPEVALRLSISRKTVEKQHSRALRLLRARLDTPPERSAGADLTPPATSL